MGGVTIGHLEKTTLAYLIADLENSKTEFKHDTKNNIVSIGDVDVLITPLQNPRSVVGVDVCLSVLDEVDDLGLISAEDTTFEAVKAVNERTRQMIPGIRLPFISMGSTSQGQLGLYRLYTQFKKSGTGIVKIRGRTRDNIHNPPGYADDLAALYTEIEQQVYLEGHFLAISRGQVFPDFNWERNYVEADMDLYVSRNEKIYWGQDFNQGYHRGCVAVVRDGVIWVLKRYEFPDIRKAPSVVRFDFPLNKIFWIPDTTAKEELTHFARELRQNNIKLIMRSKNPIVEDSAFLVNKLLFASKMMFARGARDSAEALSNARRDDRGMIPKGVGPRSPIHDCLTGDTKVMTAHGQKRIDEILPGESVLTRKGWHKVVAAAYKGKRTVRNYNGVWATEEHPFNTWTGMKAAKLLTDCDTISMLSTKEISSWKLYGYQEKLALNLKGLCGTESSITGILKRKTRMGDILLLREERGFMSQCGNIITDLCRTAAIFIIRMMIQHITGLKILNALFSMSTLPSDLTQKEHVARNETLRKLSRRLPRGTLVLKVENGIDKTVSRQWRCESLKGMFVNFVEPSLRASRIERDSVPLTISKSFTTTRKNRTRIKDVYDLSIEGQHEFFANGVLVSNCDPVRMIAFFIACNNSAFKHMKHLILDRRLDLVKEEESKVSELQAGYYSLDPAADEAAS